MSRPTAIFTVSAMLALATLATLSACQRKSAPAQPAVAAASAASSSDADPVPQGATDDSLAALMHEAFPDWDGKSPAVIEHSTHDAANPDAIFAATADPVLVVAVDDTHRVLVVEGATPDDNGQPMTDPQVPGNVAAYWFTHRGGRWFKTGGVDSLVQGGTNGNGGDIKALELAAGRHAISVEQSGCWQGKCGVSLVVVELGPDKPRTVLQDLPIQADTSGGVVGCQDALDGKPVHADDLGADECGDVTGKWRLEPRPAPDLADIVVSFTGKTLSKNDETGASTVKPADDTLVLRYSADGYKPISGNNPTPSL